MKKYVYECDGGCIMMGNGACRISIPNGYGDGSFPVYVYGPDERFDGNGYEFIGVIQGDIIYVYDYDCLLDYELNDRHILCELDEGRYVIYKSEGRIVLQRS